MSSLVSGQPLGRRFHLLRHLGSGGAGDVWLVRDTELDEDVVVKVLPADADDQTTARFRSECRKARRLIHPNVVQVFDVHNEDGRTFVTMAHVEGDRIATLRGRRLEKILNAADAIAAALAYAHGEGVTHRGLSEGNVLIDAAGRPWLVDFGIAGEVSESVEESGAPADPAVDIRALGALLEGLVAGRDDVPERLNALTQRMQAGAEAERPATMDLVRQELKTIRREAGGDERTALDSAVGRSVTVQPVQLKPPPRVKPIPPPAAARKAPPGKKGGARPRRSWGTTLGLLLLVLIAVEVVWFLPRWAEKLQARREQAAAAAPAESRAEPEPTPEPEPTLPVEEEGPSLAELARIASRAEDAGERAAELAASLDARQVDRWAMEEMDTARAAIGDGESQLEAETYTEAERSFTEAIRILEELDGRSVEVLRQALEDGRLALERGDSSGAEAAFSLAMALAPGHPQAAAGIARARVLDDVLMLMSQGEAHERRGRLEEAGASYREAARLDPMAPAVQQALARVQTKLGDRAFAAAMSDGLSALGRGEWEEARRALKRAEELQPGTSAVADALAQVDQGEKLEAIAGHRDRASELERNEQWTDAASEFQAVLDLDETTITFARNGLARTRYREGLEERIRYQLDHPERLTSDPVLVEARRLLVEAREASPAGSAHLEQVAELEQLLAVAATVVRIRLESDNMTDVTVYQVGRLGTFLERELELRPGTYTVVGTRTGYRDVRKELVVVPGQTGTPVIVRCEERI